MALDSKMTQTIGLRANGDALLKPMEAFGREINKVIKTIEKLNSSMSSGSHKQSDEMRKQVQLLQRLIGEASTLQNIINTGGKRKQGLFGALDEQALGKKTLGASKLKQELDKAKTSTDALEIRLAQLYKRFAELGNAGKSVKNADLTKALKTQEALAEVRKLEQQLSRLDARAKAKGGLSADGKALRADITNAQNDLLGRIQNGRRVDWTKEVAGLNLLIDKYRNLDKVEAQRAATIARNSKASADAAKRVADAEAAAAAKRRQSALELSNMNEAQLRASINRGSSRFSFTPDQARGFNMRAVNAEIDGGVRRLAQLQDALSKAIGQGRNQALVDRLAQSFNKLKDQISEAAAKTKAFESLPEQRMSRMNETLFGGGNWKQFGMRIGGAALIGSAAFGAINAARDSAGFVVQLEDAMARLQAISGSTDPEIKKLGATILELGGNTRYSTLEIAEAATQIAQAGFSASESGEVLQASLMLAAGSGSSVAEAVDTMTSSLGAFQLQASEAGNVADVLMEGLNRSKLSITQMQAALQYAGATAKESGINLQELTAIAASLANAGIRNGSTIGTGVRQLLVDLQTPTEKFQKELKSLGLTMADVDVRSKGLAEVVKKLTDAGFSAEAAYEGFEVRAASAFLAFRNQIDVYDELSLALTQTGAAATANERAMDSLSAKWTQAKNELGELLSILAVPFINASKAALDIITGMVGGLNDLIIAITGAAGASGEWGTILSGTLLPALAGFVVGGPIGAAIGGVLGLLGAIKDASSATEELAAATDESKQSLESSRQTVTSVDDAIARLVQRGEHLQKNHVALQVEVLDLTNKFDGLASNIDATKLSYENLIEAMLKYRGVKLQEEGEKAREVVINSVNEGRPVIQSLRANTGRLQTQLGNLNKTGPFAGKLDRAQAYINQDRNYAAMSGDQIFSETVTLRGIINDLRKLGEGNHYMDAVIKNLQDRLVKVQKIGELRGNINQAEMTQGLVAEVNSPGGQQRDKFLLETRTKITDGLNANKDKVGSGDMLLRTATNRAHVEIKNLENQLKNLTINSPKWKAVNQTITDLKAEVSRVTRAADRATEKMVKDEKAGAGENLNSTQVKNLVENEFKGSKVTSWKKRPYSDQVKYWKAYQNGTGPKAAKPGTSRHGNGNAIDMLPIRGMNIDQVAAFLESRGLEIVERLVEPNPTTGGVHWHIAWKPKSSRFQKEQDRESDKAENELQQLLEQEAGFKTKGVEQRIATIINQAKNGSEPIPSMTANLRTEFQNYSTARLAEFDTKNPQAGATGTKLKYIQNARAELEQTIKAQIENWGEQYYRWIADAASAALQQSLAAAERAFDEQQYQNGAGTRAAESNLAALGNRRNRNNFGAGTQYRFDRNLEDAQFEEDKRNLASIQQLIDETNKAVGQYNEKISTLKEGSEEYKSAMAEREAAVAKLNEQLRQQAELQGKVNDRERELTDIPLKDRLQDAARAWLDNSGAMDSWAKQAENAVGPLLDNLTNGLADFFTSIADGSKSFKQALGDMIKSFAQFVLQYIAKALALYAVKQLLNAIGVSVPSFEGGPVEPKKAYFGGPVANDNIPGRYEGGYIDRGVSNRDSALYNLAHGEYVMQSKSVSDIGLGGMEMINKHGKKGLDKVAGAGASMFQNIQMPKQETNVYVVQEKNRPPMGPNDVLVTIHEDILQGGPTKKLIKQVAQGA